MNTEDLDAIIIGLIVLAIGSSIGIKVYTMGWPIWSIPLLVIGLVFGIPLLLFFCWITGYAVLVIKREVFG